MDINLKAETWKNRKCGDCRFQTRAPRDPNKPVDLSAPKILICRWGPPNIIYAIGQQPNGQPIPVPMGSMYSLFDPNFEACSRFEEITVIN